MLFNERLILRRSKAGARSVVSLVEHCVAGLDQLLRVRAYPRLFNFIESRVPAPVAFRPAPAYPGDLQTTWRSRGAASRARIRAVPALIFDLDDTLVGTAYAHCLHLAACSARQGCRSTAGGFTVALE